MSGLRKFGKKEQKNKSRTTTASLPTKKEAKGTSNSFATEKFKYVVPKSEIAEIVAISDRNAIELAMAAEAINHEAKAENC